jgi:hypothetical protein
VVWCELLELRRLLSAGHHLVAVPPGADLAGGVLTVTGSNQADTISFSEDTATGTLTAIVDGAVSTFALGDVTQINVSSLKGNDYVYGGNVTVPMTIKGGKGNQSLVADNGTDTIIAGSGNNVLAASIGTDTFITNTGHNRLILGAGDDTIYGKAKNLVVRGTGEVTVATKSKTNALVDKAEPFVETNVATPDTVFGTASGLTPTQIRNAYDFGNLADPTFTNRGDGQAVAVVIPYNTPDITQSLATFSTTFDLPAPDINHFQIVYTNGSVPPTDPDPNNGWELEAATDIEGIHSIAPDAKIYLVLAQSSAFPDLFAGVDKAVNTLDANFGGGVVDLSWGSQGGELDPLSENLFDTSFSRAQAANVSFVAASGDVGGTISYPAISPYVTAVGGTDLNVDANGNRTAAETAWASSGGGRSANYTLPSFQDGNVTYAGPGVVTGTTNASAANTLGAFRTNVDVSYDGDPATGIATYDANTFGDINADGVADSGWLPGGAGGTSAAAAQWAGLIALANQVRTASGRGFLGNQLNAAIYHVAETWGEEDFTDITTGSAGGNAAATGFDLATGWGTPLATNLIARLGIADVTKVNGGITWTAYYQLAITQTGPLQGPGAGDFVGGGTVAGGPDGFNLTFTPSAQNLQPITYTLVAGQDDETDTSPYASITSLTVPTLKRNDATGKVYGTGTADLLVQVTVPVYNKPPSGGGSSPPTAGGGSGTGGNSSGSGYGAMTPTPTPTPTPTGTGSGYYANGNPTTNGNQNQTGTGSTYVGTNIAGQNPFSTSTTTELIPLTLSFTGTTYTSASGATHLRGTFVALDPNTGQPAQVGVSTTFTGKFKSS